MKTIILNMVFDDENKPDIGSIKFDRYRENLHLLGEDISKLNSVLTRAVCIGTYNAETFYFKSGDVAMELLINKFSILRSNYIVPFA